MPVEIRVPQLGESVVEATVIRWLKQEGEPVAAGEAVVELETDKVNVEVTADEAGVLLKLQRAKGETVAVGDILAVVETSASNGVHAPALAQVAQSGDGRGAMSLNGEQAAAPTDTAETSATPVARRLAEENHVDLGTVHGTGPNGRITKEDVEGQIARSAEPAPAARAPEPSAPTAQPAQSAPSPQPAQPPVSTPQRPVAAPQASLPPVSVPLAAQPAAAQPVAARPAPAVPVSNNVPSPSGRPEERRPMSRRRQTIATRLVEAQHNAAMLTTFNEVDMTAVMDVRKRRKDSFKEKHGVGLGFMSFFSKASIGALKNFPLLNAEIQGTEIVVKHYYDLGIAVSTEEGLVVPVVRDADRLTFAEIEKRIGELAVKARENKLTLPEIQGGTFTITNGGVFGSLLSTPILNAPQVGILGMHKIEERPIAVAGQVVIRPMMYLALSYDHRIVDGSEAVRFLVRIKELLEDPEQLLLEG